MIIVLCNLFQIFLYSTSLFKESGLSEVESQYMTSAVGGTMVAMTLGTIPLMDRLGRRTLQLAGLAWMGGFSVLITIALAARVSGVK